MPAKCPKCNSIEITTGSQGFGAGKAVVGAVAVGPLGLVAGAVGKNKTMNRCGSCGNTWNPAKAHAKTQSAKAARVEKARRSSLTEEQAATEQNWRWIGYIAFFAFCLSMFFYFGS